MPRSIPPGAPATRARRPRTDRRFRPRVVLSATLLALVAVPGSVASGHAAIGAAAPQEAQGRGRDSSPFSWPLAPEPAVVRPFEAPAGPYGPGHRGADLAAAPEQPALAAADGVVAFAGTVAGRGVVSIDHDGGLRTTYEPLRVALSRGEEVSRGQVIGAVATGHPDCAAPACLHWGVRRGAAYLDPLPLVRADPVLRLKPWDGPGAIAPAEVPEPGPAAPGRAAWPAHR